MTYLARNPLPPRSAQPDVSHIRRKYSVRPRRSLGASSATSEYNVHQAQDYWPSNIGTIDREEYRSSSTASASHSSGSRHLDEHDGPSADLDHNDRHAGYRQLLEEKLEATRGAQESWLEGITNDIRSQVTAEQRLLRTIREQRQRENEQHQREVEQQRREAEERRQRETEQEIEQWEREAERRRREEEEAYALEQAIIAAEEAERREEAAEAERERLARLRDCTVCMDPFDMGGMIQLLCEHWYCRDDFQEALQNALTARRPFHCCTLQMTLPILASSGLPATLIQPYTLLLEESTTPNPLYCSNTACALFLPPSHQPPHSLSADAMLCTGCGTSTCRHCRGLAHPGTECAADVNTQRARALAASQGWKECPRCKNLVERMSGCNHMTCRCGEGFCYVCGRRWRVCGGRCG